MHAFYQMDFSSPYHALNLDDNNNETISLCSKIPRRKKRFIHFILPTFWSSDNLSKIFPRRLTKTFLTNLLDQFDALDTVANHQIDSSIPDDRVIENFPGRFLVRASARYVDSSNFVLDSNRQNGIFWLLVAAVVIIMMMMPSYFSYLGMHVDTRNATIYVLYLYSQRQWWQLHLQRRSGITLKLILSFLTCFDRDNRVLNN